MDPLSCNLTYIFVLLFRDALNEYAYAADIVGLKWELTNSKYGMTVSKNYYKYIIYINFIFNTIQYIFFSWELLATMINNTCY